MILGHYPYNVLHIDHTLDVMILGPNPIMYIYVHILHKDHTLDVMILGPNPIMYISTHRPHLAEISVNDQSSPSCKLLSTCPG